MTSTRCTYQTCSRCRPLSKDRATIAFEELIDEYSREAAIEEIERQFKPISDIGVCRQLGLNTARRSIVRQRTQEEENLGTIKLESVDDTQHQNKVVKRRPGKSVLRRGNSSGSRAGRPYDKSQSPAISRRSLPSPPYLLQSLTFTNENQSPDSNSTSDRRHGVCDGSAKEQASIEPGGELKVDNGVAVTEEAVDTETADVITQL